MIYYYCIVDNESSLIDSAFVTRDDSEEYFNDLSLVVMQPLTTIYPFGRDNNLISKLSRSSSSDMELEDCDPDIKNKVEAIRTEIFNMEFACRSNTHDIDRNMLMILPIKLYILVNTEDPSIVGWEEEIYFQIRNVEDFVNIIMPKYFKSNI